MDDILSEDPSVHLVKASPQKRNLSGLIDAGLVFLFFFGMLYALPFEISSRFESLIRPEFSIFLLYVLYRLLTVLLLNETIGMRICGIQFLNGEFKKLSAVEKILAAFFILIHDTSYFNKEPLK